MKPQCLKGCQPVCLCTTSISSSDGYEPISIFLSWSGKVAEEIAKALRNAIHSVFGDVRVFFSDDDIAAGELWLKRLQDELAHSDFGVIILTPESIQSRWVALEFGALAKHFGSSHVIPLAVGMKSQEIPAPFNIFQAISLDADDAEVNRNAFFHMMESIGSYVCKKGHRLNLTLRRVENAWEVFSRQVSRIVGAQSRPVRGDLRINTFNAYYGDRFENAFLECLQKTETLRAASIGLAILYMSPRVEECLIDRLCRRQLDAVLTYENPHIGDYPTLDHPAYGVENKRPTSPIGNEAPEKTGTQATGYSSRLFNFLDRLFGCLGNNLWAESRIVRGEKNANETTLPYADDYDWARFKPPLIAEWERLKKKLDILNSAADVLASSRLGELDEFTSNLKSQINSELLATKSVMADIDTLFRSPIRLKVQFTKRFFFHSVIRFDHDLFVFWYGHNQAIHREPVIHVSDRDVEIWNYFEQQLREYESQEGLIVDTTMDFSSGFRERNTEGSEKQSNSSERYEFDFKGFKNRWDPHQNEKDKDKLWSTLKSAMELGEFAAEKPRRRGRTKK